MTQYRTSPFSPHDAQPKKEMSHAEHVVKVLWDKDEARTNAELRDASLPQAPIASMRLKR